MSATSEMPNETYDWEAARTRMREQAEQEYAPAWQPTEEGDELFGVLTGFTVAAPTAFGPAPVVELAKPDGERVSVWLFPHVLRKAFERQRVALGERVFIVYKGKHHPDGGGNPYHLYALVVDRPSAKGEIDWRDVADRYGDVEDETGRAATPRRDAVVDVADDDIPF